MPRIGLRTTWLIAGALAASMLPLWMWGFTVDDALISVRYARHIADGPGWRFNVGGPSTDGVTPLPWPLVLALVARGRDAMVVLGYAKALGFAAWVAAGTTLGGAIGEVEGAPGWAKAAALATVGLSVPVAAYAVSGMETPFATALATAAALACRRPWRAAALAGCAAAFRPEMAPWACALAAGCALADGRREPAIGRDGRREVLRAMGAACVALTPFALCVAVRTVAWGRPSPLAWMAKPSDLEHGWAYSGAGCAVTLLPCLAFAPVAFWRRPEAAALGAAFVVHVAAVVAVGGDWMPYARLLVPVAPSLAWAAILASPGAKPWAMATRSAVAVVWGGFLLARGGASGRSVGADRAALVAAARPVLAGARTVAALDVGWVSAATDADIVDLAGLTDPDVAVLPGGHTSKRVSAIFLLSYAPDALLLYAPHGLAESSLGGWRQAIRGRTVEARLAADDLIAARFVPVAWLPLGSSGAGYVLLRAAAPLSAP